MVTLSDGHIRVGPVTAEVRGLEVAHGGVSIVNIHPSTANELLSKLLAKNAWPGDVPAPSITRKKSEEAVCGVSHIFARGATGWGYQDALTEARRLRSVLIDDDVLEVNMENGDEHTSHTLPLIPGNGARMSFVLGKKHHNRISALSCSDNLTAHLLEKPAGSTTALSDEQIKMSQGTPSQIARALQGVMKGLPPTQQSAAIGARIKKKLR